MPANAVIVLITVVCSLLDRQLAAQAEAFEKEGGFTERHYQWRTDAAEKMTGSTEKRHLTKRFFTAS